MSFVVTENCHLCRFTDCVTVCPVDCFYGDDNQLYINPDECIDCGACEPECPVNAIYDESRIPEKLTSWIKINSEKALACKNISQKQDQLPTAESKKKELGF